MTDPHPLMKTEAENGRVVIHLHGEIDLSNVEALESQIDRAIADAEDVVIDLTAVEFLDSRGLRLLKRVSTDLAARTAHGSGPAEQRRPRRARHDTHERRANRARLTRRTRVKRPDATADPFDDEFFADLGGQRIHGPNRRPLTFM